MLFLVPIVGLLGLLLAVILRQRIVKEDPGTGRTRKITGAIVERASVFLASEYRILVASVAVLFFVIGSGTRNWITTGRFPMGSGSSIMASYLGMNAAIRANSRTVDAARIPGMHRALTLAFPSGSAMGMAVVGLGLLGVGILYILIRDVSVLSGFSLDVSSIALFIRVDGGIYTKAAGVGTNLVDKVEASILEDDPRNPAAAADNVGDNTGDVAGMGTDLFESYVGSPISILILGLVSYQEAGIIFPFMFSTCGIIATVIGFLLVKSIGSSDPYKVLKTGEYSATVLVVVCSLILSRIFFGSFMAAFTIIIGLLVGVLIGAATEIYTSDDYRFVKKIVRQSETGSATTIISGIAVGMQLTAAPILSVCVSVLISNKLMSLYGAVLAAIGMLPATGITVAIDAYGPVADNADGVAEMTGLDKNVKDITDKLNSVGNTTATIGKGFAIGSIALTVLILFVPYAEAVKLTIIDVPNTHVVVGLFIGEILTLLFSAVTMESVSKVIHQMIEEVRRQFRGKPGILEGTDRPDYASYVSIFTKVALRGISLPGLVAVLAPLATGPVLGPSAPGGPLTDVLVTDVLMAIFMPNSGGAWDNAKKYVKEGYHGGKGSDSYKAVVADDTIGNPSEGTSGLSINIFIKLMTIVSLVFALLFLRLGGLI